MILAHFVQLMLKSPSKVRTIDSIAVEYMPEWRAYRIIITGSSFLQHMIRRIVGAAIKVATTDTMTVEYIQEILNSKNPNNPLPTAPAKGLMLHEVVYKRNLFHLIEEEKRNSIHHILEHDRTRCTKSPISSRRSLPQPPLKRTLMTTAPPWSPSTI